MAKLPMAGGKEAETHLGRHKNQGMGFSWKTCRHLQNDVQGQVLHQSCKRDKEENTN